MLWKEAEQKRIRKYFNWKRTFNSNNYAKKIFLSLSLSHTSLTLFLPLSLSQFFFFVFYFCYRTIHLNLGLRKQKKILSSFRFFVLKLNIINMFFCSCINITYHVYISYFLMQSVQCHLSMLPNLGRPVLCLWKLHSVCVRW